MVEKLLKCASAATPATCASAAAGLAARAPACAGWHARQLRGGRARHHLCARGGLAARLSLALFPMPHVPPALCPQLPGQAPFRPRRPQPAVQVRAGSGCQGRARGRGLESAGQHRPPAAADASRGCRVGVPAPRCMPRIHPRRRRGGRPLALPERLPLGLLRAPPAPAQTAPPPLPPFPPCPNSVRGGERLPPKPLPTTHTPAPPPPPAPQVPLHRVRGPVLRGGRGL